MTTAVGTLGRLTNLEDDDQTLVWERPRFFGAPVPPYPADEPLPPVSPVPRKAMLRTEQETVAERKAG